MPSQAFHSASCFAVIRDLLPRAWRVVHSAKTTRMIHSAQLASVAGSIYHSNRSQAAALGYVPYLDLYLLSRVEVVAHCGTSFGSVASVLSGAVRRIIVWEHTDPLHSVALPTGFTCAASQAQASGCPPGRVPNASWMFRADAHSARPSICASQVRNASSPTGEWSNEAPVPFLFCHCDDWY
jgi:hypothetical protein